MTSFLLLFSKSISISGKSILASDINVEKIRHYLMGSTPVIPRQYATKEPPEELTQSNMFLSSPGLYRKQELTCRISIWTLRREEEKMSSSTSETSMESIMSPASATSSK